MHQQRAAFDGANARVLVISFQETAETRAYAAKHGIAFPILSDRDRAVYAAYELRRGGLAEVVSARMAWDYFRIVLSGWLPRLPSPRVDGLQLGGDFVVDPAGRLVLVHPQRYATDRPTALDLLGAARRAGRR